MGPTVTVGEDGPGGQPLHSVSFRLTYADCDPAGIVYYANYYRWMEHVHTEWWFLRGLRFDALAERYGVTMVTRAANAEFEYPLRLFDVVECSMYSDHLGHASFTQRFDFHTGAGVRTCRAAMSLVCVDADGRPARVPDPMRELLTTPGKRRD